MRFVVVFIFVIRGFYASGQEGYPVEFHDPVDKDTLTASAESVGGYKALLKYLESQLSEGDTTDKKFSIPLYNIRFRVNKQGIVDSTYIGVNHSACPMHHKIAAVLAHTKWIPAKKQGIPVESDEQLYGRLYFSKRIFKKYDCWPSFVARLFF